VKAVLGWVRMERARRPAARSLSCVFAALAFGMALALASAVANATDQVEALAQRLSTHPDFRVRTQAALALGASQDARAVPALCSGLGDSNTTVRAAAAAAMGKLQKGGKECLQSRLAAETNPAVQAVIKTALQRLEGGATPTIASGTRYYVAINVTTNNTSRSQGALDHVVREALIRAMRSQGAFAWAPAGETAAAARAVLAKHKGIRPFFIWPKVTTTYADGSLTIDFALSMFTYPGKALIGTTTKKLTMPGVGPGSTTDEDELIGMAAERLIPTVASTADRI
jgi:hypothetical protein